MDARDLIERRLRRFYASEALVIRLFKLIQNRFKPLGAFRMARTVIVSKAGSVGLKCGQGHS